MQAARHTPQPSCPNPNIPPNTSRQKLLPSSHFISLVPFFSFRVRSYITDCSLSSKQAARSARSTRAWIPTSEMFVLFTHITIYKRVRSLAVFSYTQCLCQQPMLHPESGEPGVAAMFNLLRTSGKSNKGQINKEKRVMQLRDARQSFYCLWRNISWAEKHVRGRLEGLKGKDWAESQSLCFSLHLCLFQAFTVWSSVCSIRHAVLSVITINPIHWEQAVILLLQPTSL